MPGHGEREAGDLRDTPSTATPGPGTPVHNHLPLANSMRGDRSRPARYRGGARADRRDRAAQGLDRYDPAHGAAFRHSRYLHPGRDRRYLRDFSWTVRPPRELQERAIRLEREREHSPTISAQPDRARARGQGRLHARGAPRRLRSCAGALERFFDRPAATGKATRPRWENTWRRSPPLRGRRGRRATLDRLLNTLRERDELVLRLRFHEGLTQTEIAPRIGCSQMHVSRIQRTASRNSPVSRQPPRRARRAEHDTRPTRARIRAGLTGDARAAHATGLAVGLVGVSTLASALGHAAGRSASAFPLIVGLVLLDRGRAPRARRSRWTAAAATLVGLVARAASRSPTGSIGAALAGGKEPAGSAWSWLCTRDKWPVTSRWACSERSRWRCRRLSPPAFGLPTRRESVPSVARLPRLELPGAARR